MTKRERTIVMIASWIFSPFAYAYVLSWLWAWFFVPFGYIQPTMSWMFGISLTLKYIIGWNRVFADGKPEYTWTESNLTPGLAFKLAPIPIILFATLINPAIVLMLGWITKWIMG